MSGPPYSYGCYYKYYSPGTALSGPPYSYGYYYYTYYSPGTALSGPPYSYGYYYKYYSPGTALSGPPYSYGPPIANPPLPGQAFQVLPHGTGISSHPAILEADTPGRNAPPRAATGPSLEAGTPGLEGRGGGGANGKAQNLASYRAPLGPNRPNMMPAFVLCRFF